MLFWGATTTHVVFSLMAGLYSCIVWAQNINTVNRLIILQKKALQILNFKDQLFHLSSFFSENNILKFSDKIALENILFVNKSINKQVSPIF